MSKWKNRQRAPKRWLWLMIILVVLVGVVLAANYYLASKGGDLDGANGTGNMGRNISATSGGQNATPQYREIIEQSNAEKAVEAEEKGVSFIPEPVLSKPEKNIDDFFVEEAPKQIEPEKPHWALPATPVAPKRWEPARPVQEKKEKVIGADPDILAYLDGLDSRIGASSVKPGDVSVYPIEAPSPGTAVNAAQEVAAAVAEIKPIPAGLKVGAILPAVNKLVINSDREGSPAWFEIVHGPFKGHKAAGSWVRTADAVMVTFDRLISPDGTEYAIKGRVIDLHNPSPYVASSVEYRTMSRWLALISVPILQGIGEGFSSENKQQTYVGNSVVEVSNAKNSLAEKALAGLANAGEAGGDIAKEYFNRPPTVHLDVGSGRTVELYGILIEEVSK